MKGNTERHYENSSLTKDQLQLLHSLQIPLLLLDEELRVAFVNSHYLRVFGKSEQEVMGFGFFDLERSWRLPRLEEGLDRLLREKKPFQDLPGPHPVSENGNDGLLFSASLLPERLNFILLSLSEQQDKKLYTTGEVHPEGEPDKKTRASEVHYRRMADLMPVKITNNDTQGRAIYFNQSWLDFSGLSAEEMKNRGWDQSVHPDDLPMLFSKWKHSLATGEEHEAEFRIRDKTNEYIWQLTRGVPVKDETGKIEMWITTTTDIQKLKEEEKRKEEFLKMVSHELKTPITSVKGYVQLLLTMLNSSNVSIPASLPINSSLERIDQQINRITRLISEMLDLSRIENNKLDLRLENFSINELVEETVQDINYTSQQLNIKVIHDFSCQVYADRDRLGQVVINFVTNAIKYSPGDEEVRLRISQGQAGEVAVSIEDRGIGIAQEDLEKIFQPFYRSEKNNAETYSGFGIGLFLAKEIIERHHGSVKVESELGQGSIFSFSIPCGG